MPDLNARGDSNEFTEQAREYCEQTVAGEIVQGSLMRLVCQRRLDELSRKDFPYYFDHDSAARVCRRIEALPHIQGEWASRGELLKLQPWQCFLLTTLFGWKALDGMRRFRTALWEVGRKNAKTTLAAGIGIVLLEDDGEAGAQIFSAATKRD